MDVGNRVRTLRKQANLTMKQLAEMAGISLTTMHRIETGQQSPSVAVLSLIAHNLGLPITNLLSAPFQGVQLLSHQDGVFVESVALKLRLMVPFGMIKDDISISSGRLQAGEIIKFHRNPGIEFSYVISGKCILHYDGEPYPLAPHDAVIFSGDKLHAVEVQEDIEFVAVFFRGG